MLFVIVVNPIGHYQAVACAILHFGSHIAEFGTVVHIHQYTQGREACVLCLRSVLVEIAVVGVAPSQLSIGGFDSRDASLQYFLRRAEIQFGTIDR